MSPFSMDSSNCSVFIFLVRRLLIFGLAVAGSVGGFTGFSSASAFTVTGTRKKLKISRTLLHEDKEVYGYEDLKRSKNDKFYKKLYKYRKLYSFRCCYKPYQTISQVGLGVQKSLNMMKFLTEKPN